ncbi:MAG: hypothetical protein B6D41_00770 [Chloroflexi bacterium UTCFX4]|jgi:formylglycine-generating enzyme required for sulfatase activity|nr:MAG: hypothetical protein B6D41_00770 [Chloroflexi bacterium UTCFX4]
MLICLDQRTGTGCGANNKDGAQFCAQCGRPLRFALQLFDPGALVNAYRIVRLIGHGGFGAVYEAEDTRTGQHAALKESFSPDSIRSFQREFAALKNLQHPNLPRYFEMFEWQANGYLAMEFVPGQSLQEVLDGQPGQPLLESQVIGYALQLCDALSYLHTQTPPIFHRDIKPANIRITPTGLIKLVDFGLVKQGTGTTQSSLKAGTPAYAPIEQYGSMQGAHTDARSDIYSLGATLYCLVTGQEPPAAVDRVTIKPDPLRAAALANPRVSADVSHALNTALGVFQSDRFADVNAFRSALFGIAPSLQTAPPSAVPPARPQPTQVPAQQPAPQIIIPHAPSIALPARTMNKAGQEMILIPAGEFLMGSNDQSDEKPIHKVYLDAFYISRYPVTNVEYKKFVDATHRTAPEHWQHGWFNKTIAIPNGQENHPVVYVNWDDAAAYCQWAGGRLPTEAEWEKAAGWNDANKSKRVYPWGDGFDSQKCNSSESGIYATTPIGKYSPQGDSFYGVGDMAGNVWEWVKDWYAGNYYASSPFKNPQGPSSGQSRVLRGGSFYSNQGGVRAALRDYGAPGSRFVNVGFRCAQ